MTKTLLTLSLLILSNSAFAALPSLVQLSPPSGSGTTVRFHVVGNDPDGYQDIQHLAVAYGPNNLPSCIVLLLHANTLLLADDQNVNWLGWNIVGTAGTIQNSQCSVNVQTATSVVSGGSITFEADVTFKPAFAGVHPIYGIATDPYWQTANGGWVPFGNWTVPGAAMDLSLTATEINPHVLLLDDATGQYIERPTSISPWIVRLKDGRNVHIAAADQTRVKKIQHSWQQTGDEYEYKYKIDTTGDPYIMRLGIIEDGEYAPIGAGSQQTQPKGWSGMIHAWVNFGKAELSEDSEFTVRSKWRPGLQAFFIMSHAAKDPIPSFPETENNIRIATAANIFNNSLRKFVIGPALAPDLSPEGLRELIGRWVDDYGFVFLAPLLDEQNKKTLDEIQTDDKFEREILDCLKAAAAATK